MIGIDEFLWNAIDRSTATYSESWVRTWPSAFRDSLVALKILIPAELAEYVTCPACRHRHEEPVLALPGENGKKRFFIYCPEELRVELAPSDLQQWTLDVDAVARLLAESLGLSGRCKPLEPGRLWRLGRVSWQGVLRDVLFARGLCRKSGRMLARKIGHTTRSIVFVSRRLPPPDIWRGRTPSLVRLSEMVTVGDKQLLLDREAIFARIREVDEALGGQQTAAVSVQQLKVMVRQQVNAEEKIALSDDACVAAYRSEGSCRKAAELLSREFGREVSKDRIARALKRRGGPTAVLQAGNSPSVRRSVGHRKAPTVRSPKS